MVSRTLIESTRGTGERGEGGTGNSEGAGSHRPRAARTTMESRYLAAALLRSAQALTLGVDALPDPPDPPFSLSASLLLPLHPSSPRLSFFTILPLPLLPFHHPPASLPPLSLPPPPHRTSPLAMSPRYVNTNTLSHSHGRGSFTRAVNGRRAFATSTSETPK